MWRTHCSDSLLKKLRFLMKSSRRHLRIDLTAVDCQHFSKRRVSLSTDREAGDVSALLGSLHYRVVLAAVRIG